MPALWKSSERSMYVKTVWVDGFRHAILSHDDPYLLKLKDKKRRPRSSASYAGICNRDPKHLTLSDFKKTRLSHNEDQLGECLKKLNFVIKRDATTTVPRVRPKSESQAHIEKLNLTDLESEPEDLVLKANPQPLNEFESSRSKLNNAYAEMKTFRSNRTPKNAESKESNDLSERVLQWLDLAGKIDMLIPEKESTRIAHQRHSWPEIQKRNLQLAKFKTAVDFKSSKTKAIESPKAGDGGRDKVQPESGVIDRHEFHVTTPANTIENYARLSRNVKDTPRNNARKPKDTSLVTSKTTDLTDVEQTRQKVANEIKAVERQYADLINKKIIPNYNKSGGKRQVHIFVPAMAKKLNTSTSSSRTESLLSQKI